MEITIIFLRDKLVPFGFLSENRASSKITTNTENIVIASIIENSVSPTFTINKGKSDPRSAAE